MAMKRALTMAAAGLLALAGAAHAAPRVQFQTTMGNVTIELDPAHAPMTSMIFLKTVRVGHYDGAAIFRVEPGYLIQLGDLDAKGKYREPPYPPIPLETANNHHARGAVAMAHGADPNSGQSSFYFDLAANANLNAKPGAPANTTGFTVFGHVIEGMDVLDKISAVPLAPRGGPFPGKLPKTPIVVKKAVVVAGE
jgi:peptidyl-prolyl cis-trans isomerase A (cyclophilin A)